MNEIELERFNKLCALIVEEKNPQRFSGLIRELDAIFQAKAERLKRTPAPVSGSNEEPGTKM